MIIASMLVVLASVRTVALVRRSSHLSEATLMEYIQGRQVTSISNKKASIHNFIGT